MPLDGNWGKEPGGGGPLWTEEEVKALLANQRRRLLGFAATMVIGALFTGAAMGVASALPILMR